MFYTVDDDASGGSERFGYCEYLSWWSRDDFGLEPTVISAFSSVQLPDDACGNPTEVANDDTRQIVATNRAVHGSSSSDSISSILMRGYDVHRVHSFLCRGDGRYRAPTNIYFLLNAVYHRDSGLVRCQTNPPYQSTVCTGPAWVCGSLSNLLTRRIFGLSAPTRVLHTVIGHRCRASRMRESDYQGIGHATSDTGI